MRPAEICPPAVLGARLRARREERGISLRTVARRVGISPSALSQIETGKMSPSVTTLRALAVELSLSLDEVLAVDLATPTRPA